MQSKKLVQAADSEVSGTVAHSLKSALNSLCDLESVGDVRGLGLMIGTEFTVNGKPADKAVLKGVVHSCEERGLLEPVEAEDDESRCFATTGAGSRCRNKALPGSRYCRTHEQLSVTDGLCKAVMKNGKPCPKKAREDSDYCGQHAKLAEE